MLKSERHRRILDLLRSEGRVVATDLQDELEVSGYTIRRDLDELAAHGALVRVHGGALARSPVAPTYEGRREQEVPGKAQVAAAAAPLFLPGQIAIVDGGSTALALIAALPAGHAGTVITHSPPVAAALERHTGIETIVVGGTLDRRAMVCVGAQTIESYRRVTADVCFLGVWSLHAEAGITTGYYEEAEVRRVLVDRADRVVGLASRDKLGTIAPYAVAPAARLTHLAVERDTDDALLGPLADQGINIVRP